MQIEADAHNELLLGDLYSDSADKKAFLFNTE